MISSEHERDAESKHYSIMKEALDRIALNPATIEECRKIASEATRHSQYKGDVMLSVTLTTTRKVDIEFLHVEADVRYWEDATVNGVDDEDGKLIPCRAGHLWAPAIRLDDGLITGWPVGTTADIHYKVCDQGEYWLADQIGERVAKWKGAYVPDDLLCIGDTGYGDYIILKVGADGVIDGWKQPNIESENWEPLEHNTSSS